jgi:hypothetical protein
MVSREEEEGAYTKGFAEKNIYPKNEFLLGHYLTSKIMILDPCSLEFH